VRKVWAWLVKELEAIYDPKPSMKISREHLVDINAAASRNWWYDKKGNRWPLKDSL